MSETTQGEIRDALQAISESLTGRVGSIVVPLSEFTEADLTALVAFVDGDSTLPGYSIEGSKGKCIRWNNHGTPDPVVASVPKPEDLNATADIVWHVIASKVGATLADAVTFELGVFFNDVGALHDADSDAGGTSTAMAGAAATKTVQDVSVTVDAADIADARGTMYLTLQPTDGTLGTDDVCVWAVIGLYTRKNVAGE